MGTGEQRLQRPKNTPFTIQVNELIIALNNKMMSHSIHLHLLSYPEYRKSQPLFIRS